MTALAYVERTVKYVEGNVPHVHQEVPVAHRRLKRMSQMLHLRPQHHEVPVAHRRLKRMSHLLHLRPQHPMAMKMAFLRSVSDPNKYDLPIIPKAPQPTHRTLAAGSFGPILFSVCCSRSAARCIRSCAANS
jgi:hypothetical protein